MFKLDKKTHLIILFTFAMVFVVVYLYYTITDLRKAQVEIKRLQDELAVVKNLTNTVSCMKTDVDELKTVKHIKANIAAPAAAATVSVEPVAVQEDTASSVDTEEIRDILDGGMDDEDETDVVETNVVETDVVEEAEAISDDTTANATSEVEVTQEATVEATAEATAIDHVEATQNITIEELKNMKVEELKELCREYNLATKGNKNDLLVRIFDHLGMN